MAEFLRCRCEKEQISVWLLKKSRYRSAPILLALIGLLVLEHRTPPTALEASTCRQLPNTPGLSFLEQ